MENPRRLKSLIATLDRKSEGFELPPVLAGAVALVVAVLAAVGVSGGVLTRAVRNEPKTMALLVIAALLLVGVPALWLARGRSLVAGSLAGLLAVLVWTVWVGAGSVAVREQPRIALSASTTGATTTVKITATASGLKSAEDMLVQLQAMTVFPDTMTKGLENACDQNRRKQFPSQAAVPVWPGPLLLWEQAGPGSGGGTSVSSAVEIPAVGFEGVCAYVSLRSGPETEPRSVQAYLRLHTPTT